MKTVLMAAALAVAAPAYAQIVKIDGSSTVYPITEAVAEEFQKSKKNSIKVTVGISGAGSRFTVRFPAQRTLPALSDVTQNPR